MAQCSSREFLHCSLSVPSSGRRQIGLVPLILFSLLISSSPSCKRRPPSLEAIDRIDRRSNLPLVQPINPDLAQIRERGYLVVLAPYDSTTYFIYQGEPAGYEYELLQAFAKDLGVALKMVVVTDPKSLFPLLNSGEGDIAASRLIHPVGPTTELEGTISCRFYARALPHPSRRGRSTADGKVWRQPAGLG